MNVLVTGANGQLGTEIRNASVGKADKYFFTDIAELDITNYCAVEEFLKSCNIDVVVNCAAYTNVDRAEDDYDTADLINNVAVANLAGACEKTGATLIHISTDYVFKGDRNIPYKEDCATDPTGVYGKTKLAGENAIKSSGCKFLIFRTAWLYSPYGNNFVKTMRRLTAEKSSLNVVFDQVGTPTYAADLASAIVGIIENRQTDRTGIYHFSNEGVCSWFDFAKEISELSGNRCDIRPCHSYEYPSKVVRPHFSVLDKTKYKTTFGINVPYWKDSLKKCIDRLNMQ